MFTKIVVLYMICQFQFPVWCKTAIIIDLISDMIVLLLKAIYQCKKGELDD